MGVWRGGEEVREGFLGLRGEGEALRGSERELPPDGAGRGARAVSGWPAAPARGNSLTQGCTTATSGPAWRAQPRVGGGGRGRPSGVPSPRGHKRGALGPRAPLPSPRPGNRGHPAAPAPPKARLATAHPGAGTGGVSVGGGARARARTRAQLRACSLFLSFFRALKKTHVKPVAGGDGRDKLGRVRVHDGDGGCFCGGGGGGMWWARAVAGVGQMGGNTALCERGASNGLGPRLVSLSPPLFSFFLRTFAPCQRHL